MRDVPFRSEPEAQAFLGGPVPFSFLERETRFFIVRHGRSEGNAKGLVQGALEFPLDETGRSQAAGLGAWLAHESIDGILSSPQSRAYETASIIASACGRAPPLRDALFREMETGIFSGMSLEEARKLNPEAYSEFERRSWDGVPGAESSDALFERALQAWSRLIACAQGGSRAPVVVSHGGFIQWLLRASFGIKTWMPLFPTGNCGVFELVATPRPKAGTTHLVWRRLNFQAPGTVEAS